MASNNYYRVGYEIFPFNDDDIDEVIDGYKVAYTRSVETEQPLVVWTMPVFDGPWRSCEMVYYRSRQAIESELRLMESTDALPDADQERIRQTIIFGLSAELIDRDKAAGTEPN